MEFRRIWRILVGHKWILIWLPITATLVGLGATYVLPQQYESTALVLVRPIKDIKFSHGGSDRNEALDLPVTLSAPIDTPSKTYMEVIKSRAVADQIVRTLHLDVKRPKVYDSDFEAMMDRLRTEASAVMRTVRNYLKYGRDIPASAFDLAVEDVERNLTVSTKKDTYVFDITYRSSDPAKAAAVANTAASIFLEQSADAYRRESARTREFIGKQVDESREALERARAATLAYKNSGRTFDLRQEYDQKLKNLSDLESTLAKAEGKLAGLERTEFKSSPAVSAQQADIGKLKQQISALRTDLSTYPAAERQLNAITLAEKLAQESYEFLVKQYEEARVREAANVAEIRVVSNALPSVYPAKPVKWRYAVLSFATALIIALGWALFSESLEPRVRTAADLEDQLGLAVLGVIPPLRRS